MPFSLPEEGAVAYLCGMEEKAKIIQAYKELSLESSRFPVSINAVCERAEVERPVFHKHFVGLATVQEAIWQGFFMSTINSIEASEVYAEYMVREKLLAFYFTFFEVVSDDRAFVELFSEQMGVWNYNPRCLMGMKPLFLAFLTELVEEGKEVEEVAERYVMGGDYPGWHWPQFLYLVNFWLGDKSEGYARTDQAVEKAVNFGFDVMGRNVLDSAFDLARFLFGGKGK